MRRSPLGNPVFWLVAFFVVPEVVKKCKPLAKTVGDTLVHAGETFRRAAEENSAPPAAATTAAAEAVDAEFEEMPTEPEAKPKSSGKKAKSDEEA